jgi:hypothetical protein
MVVRGVTFLHTLDHYHPLKCNIFTHLKLVNRLRLRLRLRKKLGIEKSKLKRIFVAGEIIGNLLKKAQSLTEPTEFTEGNIPFWFLSFFGV